MGPAVKDARNHNANTNLDAIVVGAGLSGLIAARRLQAKGKRVVVLEAQHHVGGRMVSHTTSNGTVVDLGGQWGGSSHHGFGALLKELGIERYPSYYKGKGVFQWQGKRQEAPLANDFAESILFFEPEALALPSEEMEAARLLLNELSELVARVDRQQPWLTDGGEQLDRLSVAGAFTTYMTTGAWTSFGPAWREPVGRIVWAGTESSSRWAGFYEGAIQAGLDSATSIASLLS